MDGCVDYCRMPPFCFLPLPPFLGAILHRGDFVGFTFLLGTLALFAASFFFLFERATVPDRWKTVLLVSSLITLTAGTNYAFMSAVWLSSGTSPAEFRYLDWFVTVPLICLQFYLLLEASGASPGRGMLWRLVLAALWMLLAGYVGQVVESDQSILWGALSSVGYAVVLFEISFGEARLLSGRGDEPRAKGTYDLLFLFILFGWGIYPLGYMTNPGNLLARWQHTLNLDVVYNLGDAVNKIGFGLVLWNLAKHARSEQSASVTNVPAKLVADPA